MGKSKNLIVVCGIIKKESLLFVARRKKGKILEGLWEFPGGKVERNENHEKALARELKEELGMNIEVGKLLTDHIHEYLNFTIQLYAYECNFISASFELTDHDKYEWVRPQDIRNYDLAPADKPILEYILNTI